MKKILFVAAALCLFSMAAFAQKANYAGTWTLDVSKSKLNERMRIESMTLTVAQTDKDLSVTTVTKRAAPPADAPAGRGGGMGRGFGGDGTTVWVLDGKGAKFEIDSPMGKVPVALKAAADGGKLNLTRTVTTQMGDMTTKETWELSPDGKTLTINREQPSRGGGTSTVTMVFTKG